MIKIEGIEYKKFNFPVGEMHVNLGKLTGGFSVQIDFEFERVDEIVELMLIGNALRRNGNVINRLTIPYVPFSRQDRINEEGECFSLEVFAEIINGLNPGQVYITDPHSDVTTALIKNCVVIHQHEIFQPILENRKEPFYLISPDAGALKKIYKLATLLPNCLDVVECSKQRNTKTGEITGVNVHANTLKHKDCIIVDDICDGGRTFVELAKQLKNYDAGKIILMVTHGFFTKGLAVFDGLIDEIYTRKGRVK